MGGKKMKTRIKIIKKANGQLVYIPQKMGLPNNYFDNVTIMQIVFGSLLTLGIYLFVVAYFIFDEIFIYQDLAEENTLPEAKEYLDRELAKHYKNKAKKITAKLRAKEEKRHKKTNPKTYLTYP